MAFETPITDGLEVNETFLPVFRFLPEIRQGKRQAGSVNEIRQGNARVVIGPEPQRELASGYKGPVAPKAIVGNSHPGDRRSRVDIVQEDE